MNKKIKIIDILKITANGEQPPKRIKSEDKVFYFKEDETSIDYLYRVDKTGNGWLVVQDLALNDEVEILEDNTEEIEELTLGEDNGYGLLAIEKSKKQIEDKINELVREVRQQRKINDEIIMCLKRTQCFLTKNGFKEVGKYIDRTEYAANKLRKEKE